MIDEDLKGKYQRGLRAFRNKEYESAIEYFSEAVGYDENDHKAWNALGTACSIVGRHSDADLCYENALTIDPENETYLKNRVANAKKMKKPPPGLPKGSAGSFLDRLPFDRIPIDRTYLLAGIAIIAVIILGALLLFAFSQFSAPAAPPGPAFDLSVNQSNGVIYLTNQGGSGLGAVSSFSWKVNDIPVGTGEPGDPATLGIQPGSIARVPVSELSSSNLSEGMRVMVMAEYPAGGSEIVLVRFLPPPPAEFIPVTAPEETPAPEVAGAAFSPGDVIVNGTGESWWLVTGPPANGTYPVARAARTPNGSFIQTDDQTVTIPSRVFEETGRSIGTSAPGGTPAGLRTMTPPPVTGIDAMHPGPVYVTGDLVNANPSGDTGMLLILGYDEESDQYQADTLNKYYTGEWGYRTNATPQWFIRGILEEQYPHRADRMAMSRVGIGEDSAPPGTPVKYRSGDIISPDKAGLDHLFIITGYTPGHDTYGIDPVNPSAVDSGWIRSGVPEEMKRAYVERDYPYLMKSVDISLVKTR